LGVRQPMVHVRLMKKDHYKISTSGYGTFMKFALKDFTENNSWDYFRINRIVVKYIPDQTNVFIRSTIDGLGASVIDYDGRDAPTSLKQLINQQTARLHRFSYGFTRSFVPRVAIGAQTNSTATTDVNPAVIGKAKQWLNMEYAATPHNGLAVWTDGYTGTGDPLIGFSIVTKAYVSFKGYLSL